ncbi:MAG: hypothetical protein RLZZ244_2699 [Verrucomicrobiota bacterium]|jgi:hypothetical protein
MKKNAMILLWLGAVGLSFASLQAEEGKGKMLDSFNTIDPKTVKLIEVKAKVVSTPDPAHKRVVEVTCDYAKAGGFYHLHKLVPEGLLDARKYSGFRFWAKSDTATKFQFGMWGASDKEGKYCDYRVLDIQAGPEWKQFTFPFTDFKFFGAKIFRDGKQIVFPPAPFEESVLPRVQRVGFAFHVENRGNSVVSNVLLDGLELVGK